MPAISLITPVHNSEQFLEECFASVLSQTFDDFEYIIIDDGSTDNSARVCDECAEFDKRVRVIHKENSGLGAAYNIGINEAKGEYIGFLESDDFMDIHMLEYLDDIAKKKNCPDIIKSSWFDYYSKDNTVIKNQMLKNFNSYDVINISKCPSLISVRATVWSAIYKKEFLDKKNIRYLETPGANYQDVSFTYKVLALADSIVVTPDAFIYYRKDNENSSINSTEKSEAIFWEYAEVDKLLNNNPKIKEIINEEKLIKQFFDYLWNRDRIRTDLKTDFKREFSKQFRYYRDNNELTDKFYQNFKKEIIFEVLNQQE